MASVNFDQRWWSNTAVVHKQQITNLIIDEWLNEQSKWICSRATSSIANSTCLLINSELAASMDFEWIHLLTNVCSMVKFVYSIVESI